MLAEPAGAAALWDAANDVIVHLAAAPGALAVVALFCALDGIFPPAPSDAVVMAAAAGQVAAGGLGWGTLALWLAATVGAAAGDFAIYRLGGRLRPERWRALRSRRGAAAFAQVKLAFSRSGGPVLVTARFVPGLRVVASLAAGAAGYPRRSFLVADAAAASCWAAYAVGLGSVAGWTVGDRPLLGMACGMAVAVLVGAAVSGRAAASRPPSAPTSPGRLPRSRSAFPAAPPLGAGGSGSASVQPTGADGRHGDHSLRGRSGSPAMRGSWI
jgi:membrane protein DedA with SNARE-associated domain